MRRRRTPRRAGGAIGLLVADLQPASLLADVQRVWPDAVGAELAARATPTAARDGVVHLTCESATWAQELSLMADELLVLLEGRLGAGVVRELRCSAVEGRGWSES